jgi:hypothetical protein
MKEVPSVADMIISVLAFLVLVSAAFAVLAVLVGALGIVTGSRLERCRRCQRLGLMNDRWPQHRRCSPRQLLVGSNGLNSPPEKSASVKDAIVEEDVGKGTSHDELANDYGEALLRL